MTFLSEGRSHGMCNINVYVSSKSRMCNCIAEPSPNFTTTALAHGRVLKRKPVMPDCSRRFKFIFLESCHLGATSGNTGFNCKVCILVLSALTRCGAPLLYGDGDRRVRSSRGSSDTRHYYNSAAPEQSFGELEFQFWIDFEGVQISVLSSVTFFLYKFHPIQNSSSFKSEISHRLFWLPQRDARYGTFGCIHTVG